MGGHAVQRDCMAHGEAGLSWLSVRAYDPALGRFISREAPVPMHLKLVEVSKGLK